MLAVCGQRGSDPPSPLRLYSAVQFGTNVLEHWGVCGPLQHARCIAQYSA